MRVWFLSISGLANFSTTMFTQSTITTHETFINVLHVTPDAHP